MKRAAGAAAGFLLLLPATVRADGLIPPRPYHYLHPPRSLAHGNRPPATLNRTLALRRGRLTVQLAAFTRDGQAGLVANAGAITASAPATRLRLRIAAVTPVAPMPHGLLLDGNAYRVSLTALPRGRVTIHSSLALALSWPHAPTAVLRETGRHWRVACDRRQWEISATAVVICRVHSLGVFAAAHTGSKG